MAKAVGLGGVFFKCDDPKAQMNWYSEHLGLEIDEGGFCSSFFWRHHDNPDKEGYTVFGPFKRDTEYFNPSDKPFMINLVVDDLDGVLEKLRAAGVSVDDKIEDLEYGRFGWAMDPEGIRIELWEPNGPLPNREK